EVVRRRDAVLGEQVVDAGLVLGGDVGEEDILLGRDANDGSKLADDGAEPRAEAIAAVVLDAAILDTEAEEPFAAGLLPPAEVEIEPGDRVLPRHLRCLLKVILCKDAAEFL